MLLAVFLNSIGLSNVEMVLNCYDKPFGDFLEVVQVKLDECDIERLPYKFMRVFAFYIYAVDNGYNLLVKVSIN